MADYHKSIDWLVEIMENDSIQCQDKSIRNEKKRKGMDCVSELFIKN